MRIALLLFPFALGGCLSMSSFQTAKTTKPGKVSAHVGLGSQGTKFSKKSEDKDEADLQKAIESLRVPILEGGLRVGLSDNFDIGGKLALLPGSVGLDMKYRLIGKGAGFGMATGIGGDYGSFTLTSGTADTEVSNEITIADVWVPLYLSLSFGKTSAIYLSPRAVSRTTTNKVTRKTTDTATATSTTTEPDPTASQAEADEDVNEAERATLAGASAGVQFGWFALEYSVLTGTQGDSAVYLDQVMFGVRIASDNIE